jgi:small-conductance mechanosensitive channel
MDAVGLQDALVALIAGIRATLRTELTSIWLPVQLGAILVAAVVAWAVGAGVRRKFDLVSATMGWPPYLRLAIRALIANFGVLVFICIAGLARAGIEAGAEHPRTYLLDVAVNLATAWVVIAILASLIRNPYVNRVVAVSAWTVAALSILGLLDATADALNARGIVLGGVRVTPLLVLKTTALLLVALWAAVAVSNVLVRRVQDLPDLTPAIRNLAGTLIRVAVMTVAVVVVLSSVGIDLSVLAVFTGAIGVGIGFGLQKIVSNFVSGLILLADKSIKPGDIVSIGDQVGWVSEMGVRYTSIDTRDGREILVPNEDFVTQRVVNWSYSNDLVRVDVKFGTTYAGDPRRTQEAAVGAALGVPQVLKQPAPLCHLTGFGSTSIEFVLWFWIRNPTTDLIGVRSAVMLALWDTLEREGIAIPRPGATRVILEQAS